MNKQVTAAELKANLSELLDRAAAGEETLITRHGKPVARLSPAPQPAPPGHGFGVLKGTLKYDPDLFFEPPTEQEMSDWEGDLDEFLAMTVEESEAYSRELAAKRRKPGRNRK